MKEVTRKRLKLTDLSIRKLPLPERGQVAYWDEALPGFGIRCSRRSKSFVVMYGKRRHLKTIGRHPEITLSDARRVAKGIQSDIALVSGATPTIKTISYSRARDLYLAACKQRLKPRTVIEYTRHMHFFDFDRALADISKHEVMRRIEELRGPIAQNHAMTAIRTFFNWCVQNEWLDRNPISGGRLPNKARARDRVLDDDEIAAVWAATEDYPFGQIARALLLTGQRRTEISSLRWDQITDTITFTETKNDETHIIPVGARMRALLDALPASEAHVFGSNFSGWSKSKRRLDKVLDIAPWTLHDLRRTFATRMAQLGTPIHVTERLLNHKSGTISGVAAIYNRHSYMEEMRAAIGTYEAHLAKLVGKC